MRRKFRVLCLFAAIAAATVAAAGAAPAGEEAGTLYLYCQVESISKSCIDEFETLYNCRVDVVEYESYEAMYEAVGSGHIGYDLIVSTGYVVKNLYESGSLREIDHRLLPNRKHVGSRVLEKFPDPDMVYHVPYAVSIMGVGYNRRAVGSDVSGGWNIFARDDYGKRGALFGDARLALGAALKHLELSANTTDRDEIARAGEVLRVWKERSLLAFSTELSVHALGEGELFFVQAFNGDMARLMRRNPDLGFFVPEEGTIAVADCFAVPSDATNVELAHAFINHMLDPETAASNMEDVHCYMPNPDARALLHEDVTSSSTFKVSYEMFMAAEPILDVGDAVTVYDDVWLSVLINGG